MSTYILQPSAVTGGIGQPPVIEPCTLSIEPSAVLRGEAEIAAAQPVWFAVYTCANHEKRVAEQFTGRNVEHFLPQYESTRRWKDRKVRLHLPLFPGYLFVHIASQERLRVLQVPGVVQLVGPHGSPTPLPEEDISRIREFLGQGWRAHPYLQAGRRARVMRGPLAGIEGIVLRRKNRSRLVLSLDLIQRSMAIEMDEGDLGLCEAVHS